MRQFMFACLITTTIVLSSAHVAVAAPDGPTVIVDGIGYGLVGTTITGKGGEGSTVPGQRIKRGGGAVATPGGAPAVTCTYELDENIVAGGALAGKGSYYYKRCSDGTINWVWLPNGSAPSGAATQPQMTPAQLAQQAANQLQLPDPQVDLSPSPDIVAYQLVNLPTWWAVANWAPQTQRTQLGPVFAEVTATPVSTRFAGGDGSTPVTCNRPGVKWRSGLPEELPQACRFTYQQANEQVTATISMTWRVTWVGSGGAGGTLPPITTSTDIPLTVYERQAVVTSGRG